MNETHYPEDILPKSSYIMSMDIDELINDNGFVVLSRRIDKDIEECEMFNGKRMIEAEEFYDNIVNMSLNIHGGNFNIRHIPFRQIKPGTNNWNGKDIDMNQFSQCYEYKEVCFPIFLKSTDIHNITLPYHKTFSKEKDYRDTQNLINRYLEPFKPDTEYILNATVKLRHVPTMLNYWHAELTVLPEDTPEKPLDNKKSAWKKNLFHSISEDVIQRKYTTEQPVINKIKEIFFKKQ